jgi:hypothetical protein
MNVIAPLLLALTLASSGIAVASAAQTFQVRRDALATQVNGAVGPDAGARMKPLVNDAQNRIIGAVRDVGTRQKSPLDILNFGQKMALRRARRTHTEPQLDLTPDQRSAITAYIGAVAAAVAPIVRDDGTKIGLLLTPQQRSAIDALRLQARAAVQMLPAPAADGMPDLADAFIDSGFADAGSFVLLVEIDPNVIASALR